MVTTTMMNSNLEKNCFEEMGKNKCILLGVVTSGPLILSDGKNLYKVDTYRPRKSEEEFDNGINVIDTFFVVSDATIHSTMNKYDVVRIEGSLGYLTLDSEKYGFCPVCGKKQEIFRLKDIPVLYTKNGNQQVISSEKNYSDGMQYLEKMDAYKEHNGWMVEAYFDGSFEVEVGLVNRENSFYKQEVTRYDTKVNGHHVSFAHNGADLIVSRYLKYDLYLGISIMQKEVKGIISNVFAYVAMPWSNYSMEFCNNCDMSFDVSFTEPVFFLKEEPKFIEIFADSEIEE